MLDVAEGAAGKSSCGPTAASGVRLLRREATRVAVIDLEGLQGRAADRLRGRGPTAWPGCSRPVEQLARCLVRRRRACGGARPRRRGAPGGVRRPRRRPGRRLPARRPTTGDAGVHLTGGANMWAARDEFQFAWKKTTGDFIVQTRVELSARASIPPQAGPDRRGRRSTPTRLISTAPCTATADFAPIPPDQGRGSPSRSSRRQRPDVVQLERKGNTYISPPPATATVLSARSPTSPRRRGPRRPVPLLAQRRRGRAGRLPRRAADRPGRDGFRPYRDYIGSILEMLDVAYRRARRSSTQPRSRSRPRTGRPTARADRQRQRRDRRAAGRLHRFDLATRRPTIIDTGDSIGATTTTFSRWTARCLGSATEHRQGPRTIFTVPATGGEPKRIAPPTPSYLHGWSPDGKFLVYTGSAAGGNSDIYNIASDGRQKKIKLTTGEGPG